MHPLKRSLYIPLIYFFHRLRHIKTASVYTILQNLREIILWEKVLQTPLVHQGNAVGLIEPLRAFGSGSVLSTNYYLS